MTFTNDFQLEKYKRHIIFSLFFILWSGIFYFLILSNIFSITDLNKRMENERNTALKYENNLEKLKKNRKILKKRYENKLDFAENIKEEKKKTYFSTTESFERYIGKAISRNFLKLKTIARTETIKDSNKVYFPYKIEGQEHNLLTFISDLENGTKKISFSDTPFTMTFGKPSVFDGKIAGDILNTGFKKETKEDFISFHREIGKNIAKVSALKLGVKNYLILYFNDGTKVITAENEEIVFGNQKYKVRVRNKGVYFEK